MSISDEKPFFRKNKYPLKMRGLSIPDICDLYRIDRGNLTIFNYLVTIQLETKNND